MPFSPRAPRSSAAISSAVWNAFLTSLMASPLLVLVREDLGDPSSVRTRTANPERAWHRASVASSAPSHSGGGHVAGRCRSAESERRGSESPRSLGEVEEAHHVVDLAERSEPLRFLMCDRDQKFTDDLTTCSAATGLRSFGCRLARPKLNGVAVQTASHARPETDFQFMPPARHSLRAPDPGCRSERTNECRAGVV